MNVRALLNTLSTRAHTLPIVILYVTEGCNLACLTCSYRAPLPNELSLEEIRELANQLKRLGLRHIVYSGGEPLLRRDFPEIAKVFAGLGVKQTLLTNGLLLRKQYPAIGAHLHEIIVSLDGADAATHDAIRGVESFDVIVEGIRSVAGTSPRPLLGIRSVLQKRNFHQVCEMVDFARNLSVDRISFLAADVLSDGFGRDTRGAAAADEEIMLSHDETLEFRRTVDRLVSERKADFDAGFISQPVDRFYHIVQYYEALATGAAFPRNVCNAPMVSAVITATGELLPCYFLSRYGNIRQEPLAQQINCDSIRTIRRQVRRYALDRCRTCVCTLHVQPHIALFDQF